MASKWLVILMVILSAGPKLTEKIEQEFIVETNLSSSSVKTVSSLYGDIIAVDGSALSKVISL